MRLHMHAADVRSLVNRYFLELGAAAVEVADVQENIRIDRGRCVARCYRVAEMFAMWLIDVGVLQFYDADGEMLHTVNLFTELQPSGRLPDSSPSIPRPGGNGRGDSLRSRCAPLDPGLHCHQGGMISDATRDAARTDVVDRDPDAG